jgi:hypothetical protein
MDPGERECAAVTDPVLDQTIRSLRRAVRLLKDLPWGRPAVATRVGTAHAEILVALSYLLAVRETSRRR